MNRLEDIELQLGDKITFNTGEVNYVESKDMQYSDFEKEKWYGTGIVKIERYEELPYVSNLEQYYKSVTIWEREEEPTNDYIEEINLDIIESSMGQCVSAGNCLLKIEKKLNEVIRKVNKENK